MIYQDYPKTMKHPHHQPAKLGKAYGQGTPEKFPEVVVHDSDQEEQHKAMGYVPNGEASAAGFAASQNAPGEDYEFHEYPKMIGDKIVNSAAEEAAAPK